MKNNKGSENDKRTSSTADKKGLEVVDLPLSTSSVM
jgi:hypothetical protein